MSLTHLESRCVLNGAPPVAVSAETPGVSTENALQSSHDQHADVLRLEREGEGTQLTNANDSPPSERIAGLYSRPLNGSGANHRMFADVRQEKRLSNAGPPLESAVQASVAGESLVIRGGVAQSVSYSIGAHGGSVNIDGVVIAFDATMAVSDNLQASHREFIIDGDRANLGLSEVSGGYLSLSDSTRFANIAFPYPAESLSIQTRNTERSNDQEFTVVSVEGDTFDVGMLNSRGIQISIAARNSDFINIRGAVRLDGGGFSATAGTIRIDQHVSNASGSIDFEALRSLEISTGGSLVASDVSLRAPAIYIDGAVFVTQGGVAHIDAGLYGTATLSGTIDASGTARGQTGGSVRLLGNQISIVENARIDVSGDACGGTVLVGGDYQGSNPGIQNASQVFVGSDTFINADALSTGSGGRVIVWSNERTRFEGSITARGGELGGDGGFVETSGQQSLQATGSVTAAARHGTPGQWLLDPYDVTIKSGAADPTFNGIFDANGINTISTGTIENALRTGTSVTISTGSGGTERGDISLVDPIRVMVPDGSTPSLTMNAAGNVTFASAAPIDGGFSLIVNSGGTMTLNNAIDNITSLSLKSSRSISQSAGGRISTGGLLTTVSDGGTILEGTGNSLGSFQATNTGSGNISLVNTASTLTLTGISETGGGTVSVNNTGALLLTGKLSADGGAVNLTASTRIAESGGAISTPGLLTTVSTGGTSLDGANQVGEFIATNVAGGDVSLTNSGALSLKGVSQAGGGSVVVNNAGTVAVFHTVAVGGAGNVSLSATGSANGITMDGAAAIQSGSGQVSLDANGSITVSNLKTASLVSLNSSTGALVIGNTSGTANAGLPNVASAAAVFVAFKGIGATNAPIGTQISTLAAANTGSGDIVVSNKGPLTIAPDSVRLNNVPGVTNNGGSITISTRSPLDVLGAVIAGSGGNISLSAGDMANPHPTDNISVSGRIIAIGGGTVSFTAANNLTIGTSVTVTGNGRINTTAGGSINLVDGASLETERGIVKNRTNVFLEIIDMFPLVDRTGDVVVSGRFGTPGEKNLTITVDWNDLSTTRLTDRFPPGDPRIQRLSSATFTEVSSQPFSFSFTHNYESNPDTVDPAAEIPIVVTVSGDQNVTFNSPLFDDGTQTNPDLYDPDGDGTKLASAVVFASVPWVVETAVVPLIDVPVLNFTDFVRNDALPQLAVPMTIPMEPSLPDMMIPAYKQNADSLLVILQKVRPSGETAGEILLAEDVLDDLPAVFSRLRDGRYRVIVQEPGQQRGRLIMDVNIRQGKVADESGAGRERPPLTEIPEVQMPDATLPGQQPAAEKPAREQTAVEDPCSGTPPAPPDKHRTSSRDRLFEESGCADAALVNPAERRALVVAGVLAIVSAGANWEDRVDRAMRVFNDRPLTRAAYLFRSLLNGQPPDESNVPM